MDPAVASWSGRLSDDERFVVPVGSSHERDRQACLPRVLLRGHCSLRRVYCCGTHTVVSTATHLSVCRITSCFVTDREQVTCHAGLTLFSGDLRKEKNGGAAQARTPFGPAACCNSWLQHGREVHHTVIGPVDSTTLLRGKARSKS